jgi:hypothetical protein
METPARTRKSVRARVLHLSWAAATIGAFVLGWGMGQSWQTAALSSVNPIVPGPVVERTRPAALAAQIGGNGPAPQPAGTAERSVALLERVSALEAAGDEEGAAAARQTLFDRILQYARVGRGRDAR